MLYLCQRCDLFLAIDIHVWHAGSRASLGSWWIRLWLRSYFDAADALSLFTDSAPLQENKQTLCSDMVVLFSLKRAPDKSDLSPHSSSTALYWTIEEQPRHLVLKAALIWFCSLEKSLWWFMCVISNLADIGPVSITTDPKKFQQDLQELFVQVGKRTREREHNVVLHWSVAAAPHTDSANSCFKASRKIWLERVTVAQLTGTIKSERWLRKFIMTLES